MAHIKGWGDLWRRSSRRWPSPVSADRRTPTPTVRQYRPRPCLLMCERSSTLRWSRWLRNISRAMSSQNACQGLNALTTASRRGRVERPTGSTLGTAMGGVSKCRTY